MSIRSSFAIMVGKTTRWGLHTFFKGGSSLPGMITQKIDPNVLGALAKDYEVVIVTGTNGKTLTTALTFQVLKQKYPDIITNPTGANMQQGIISTFLTHDSSSKKGQKKVAVLEVDEASLVHVTKYIKPKAILYTNVFRDQMDRFGEIYTIYQMMVDGAALAPNAKIISNGDAPIFNSLDTVNERVYFGFDNQPDGELMAHYNTDGVLCPRCQNILHYKFITYSNLGKYYCPNCDFKRPELSYRLTKMGHMDHKSSEFEIDGEPFKINVGGLYNVYNALSAYSIGRIFDVEPAEIRAGFNLAEKVFGRQEVIQIGDKEVTINLVKNPVGLNQILEMIALDPRPFSLVSILNANYADGIDISWIWDANYERIMEMNIQQFTVSGERVADIATRLEVAGVPKEELQVIPNLSDVIKNFANAPTQHIYVLATYTAVLQLRKELAAQGYVKEGM
ncbi:MurT ligase domain-containing protein [Carnobacterium gallinarum]|uniref:Mur ligase family protein n=1 Tax=Carnobacterium gallinarum TaxID=2749 RepID=UPI000553C96F|nr:Mur ligase family protein [Carnobacterium gallinarum]